MNAYRGLLAVAACSSALIAIPRALEAGGLAVIYAYSSCPDGSTVRVGWDYVWDFENPPAPQPEWVGYDVYRRPLSDCDAALQRVNPDVIPRSYTHHFDDSPPALEMFEYRVVPVDASRQQIAIPHSELYLTTWMSCPVYSAPVSVATVEDWGWAVFLSPCPNGCWPGFYVTDDLEDELRAYAGTGTALRLYGTLGCGSVEGCYAHHVDRFEVASCDPTPTVRASWGRLKSIYR